MATHGYDLRKVPMATNYSCDLWLQPSHKSVRPICCCDLAQDKYRSVGSQPANNGDMSTLQHFLCIWAHKWTQVCRPGHPIRRQALSAQTQANPGKGLTSFHPSLSAMQQFCISNACSAHTPYLFALRSSRLTNPWQVPFTQFR